jgi:endonuclease/exonuclease/phosphatase family metal-dependent hydrolase
MNHVQGHYWDNKLNITISTILSGCFILSVAILMSCKDTSSDVAKGMTVNYSPSLHEIKPCKKDSFTVAFYNLENCFDFEYDSTEYPEYIPGSSSWTREIQLVKINTMAEVISSINSDVIGLCEVEDSDALNDLKKGLQRYGVPYKYSATGCGRTRSNTCPMLLSRFPVENIKLHHVDLPGKSLSREILEADIVICSRVLKIFVNHWPSKLHPESYRKKAAEVLAARLQELPTNCEYILIGDFNSDYNESQTFSSFKLNDTDGKTGINDILGTMIDENSTKRYVSDTDVSIFSITHHYDLWIDIPEHLRMSMIYKGNNQTPDHIIVPGTLCDSTGISYVDNSFASFTWDGKLLKDGKPYRWQTKWVKKQKIHLGKGYSDHLPVLARFKVGAFTKDKASPIEPAPYIVNKVICPPNKIAHSEGFETSSEGWIACAGTVTVRRDSTTAKSGRFSLNISTPPIKTNVTVARVTVKKELSGNSIRGLFCKGNGKMSFRTRSGDDKWTYFNAPDFKASKSARYKEGDFSNWMEVKFDREIPMEDMELEIRAGKEVPLNLWIDEVY